MIRELGNLFLGKPVPVGQQIGLMVPRMRPALRRVHPCLSIRHVRGTNVPRIFMLHCSFLAVKDAVTRTTEGMIGLMNELHGVDTGPSKSDILKSSKPTSLGMRSV
jgi:hypothetical protein